jgi:hypothetical protein
MARNMVLTYLHFRILKFPLIYHHLPVKGVNLKMSYINSINGWQICMHSPMVRWWPHGSHGRSENLGWTLWRNSAWQAPWQRKWGIKRVADHSFGDIWIWDIHRIPLTHVKNPGLLLYMFTRNCWVFLSHGKSHMIFRDIWMISSGNFLHSYWKWPIEIVDLPNLKMVIFHRFLYVYPGGYLEIFARSSYMAGKFHGLGDGHISTF